jgi:imidazoleglycerol phosphate synthase glutamine amidotransferase subunit HisH
MMAAAAAAAAGCNHAPENIYIGYIRCTVTMPTRCADDTAGNMGWTETTATALASSVSKERNEGGRTFYPIHTYYIKGNEKGKDQKKYIK